MSFYEPNKKTTIHRNKKEALSYYRNDVINESPCLTKSFLANLSHTPRYPADRSTTWKETLFVFPSFLLLGSLFFHHGEGKSFICEFLFEFFHTEKERVKGEFLSSFCLKKEEEWPD